MRHLLAAIAVASLLLFAGCGGGIKCPPSQHAESHLTGFIPVYTGKAYAMIPTYSENCE